MRMIEDNFGVDYFRENPNVREQVAAVLAPWSFADACCVDVNRNQKYGDLEFYFRCPNTEAGVFLPISYLADAEWVEWLRRNLEDTTGIAERRQARKS